MNREIKFRGFSKSENKWFYGFLTFNKESGKAWIGSFAFGNYYFVEVAPESVGQFTGLHDKNGGEICEGDVLEVDIDKPRSPNYHGVNSEYHTFKVSVEWDGGFCFTNLSKGKTWKAWHRKRAYDLGLSNKLIIGNVYQNPELINK